MKKTFFALVLFASTHLFGGILLNLTSFKADFTQQINDKENKIVTYEGKIYAKKTFLAFWHYTKPVQKDIYIDKISVVVVEPELEQVIIRKIHEDFDIFALLKSAKEIGKNKYEAPYKDVVFTLYYDGKDIQKLQYNDNFDNLVTITFTNQKYDITLEDTLFKPDVPNEYDMIIE